MALYMAKDSTYKSVFRIRDRIVTNVRSVGKNNFFNNKEWLLECPKSIRQNAVKDALSNLKACFTNLKNKNIKHFTAPFKRKRHEMLNGWSMGMDKANVHKSKDALFIFKTVLGEMKYYNTKQFHKLMPDVHPDKDTRIQKDRYGDYYLVLSIEKKTHVRNQNVKVLFHEVNGRIKVEFRFHASASLDPGIRKTLVTYSPENEESFMIGKGQSTDLIALLISYDKLLSKADKSKHLSKQDKMQMKKIRKRVFYLKKEFRDQTASFLAQRYNVLLVPKLETHQLAATTRLKTKVVRSMFTIGHAELYDAIKRKCQEYGTTFLNVLEHYSSQTCVHCGSLNKCNETYKCKQCGFCCDRDILGAAGIYLKAVRTSIPKK